MSPLLSDLDIVVGVIDRRARCRVLPGGNVCRSSSRSAGLNRHIRPMELQSYAVPGLTGVYYIPDFVSEDEEAYMIRKITESPQQKWKVMPNRRLQTWGGEIMKNRLLPQPMPPYIVEFPNVIGRIQQTGAFHSSPHGRPNHVILNEYLPGQGIMPHEDGPSYHPVVATLSLGSHAVFHYYRYKDGGGAREEPETTPTLDGKGRPIDPTPVASVFLEPRSLIITTGELYVNHLHGIDEVEQDVFPDPGTAVGSSTAIANVMQLGDEAIRRVVQDGGVLKREVRYSLTCRDVEKVMTGAGLAIGRR